MVPLGWEAAVDAVQATTSQLLLGVRIQGASFVWAEQGSDYWRMPFVRVWHIWRRCAASASLDMRSILLPTTPKGCNQIAQLRRVGTELRAARPWCLNVQRRHARFFV